MSLSPDSKDWTWVLERPCPECGFDPTSYPSDTFVPTLQRCANEWKLVLARDDASVRTREDRWSALEYGCHVRDVCCVMDGRLALMLVENNPVFPNWDQDETALAEHYDQQDPTFVGAEIVETAGQFARRVGSIGPTMWSCPGTRSNGSHFSAETLVRYALHDLLHHLWDVNNDQ